MLAVLLFFFFFFQAEDGIRDLTVTGVQTCALPISITFFDPRRVVAHPGLSLAGGAIKGWDRRNQFYFQMLSSLATHFKFNLDAPFESLPKKIQDTLLFGTGKESIAFQYPTEKGRKVLREHPFEGIIPNLER